MLTKKISSIRSNSKIKEFINTKYNLEKYLKRKKIKQLMGLFISYKKIEETMEICLAVTEYSSNLIQLRNIKETNSKLCHHSRAQLMMKKDSMIQ